MNDPAGMGEFSREGFRPITNTRDDSLLGRLKFHGRMLIDLQVLTIFKDVRKFLPFIQGDVLDVGCGESPYRFLLNAATTRYHGIDIADAEKFDYRNPDITPFNGADIPFANETMDAVLCTEVLEHVFDHARLVAEIHRVLKRGGQAMITIPWSARYHYIPYDYFRYTPSALARIFSEFAEVRVTPRGTDVAVIANKLTVLLARTIMRPTLLRIAMLPLLVLTLPVLACCVLIAHIQLQGGLGSHDDPLGYTVLVRK